MANARPAHDEPANDRTGPPGGARLKVLVADGQALFRRGLSVVLSASQDIEVVGEAADGEEAVAKAHELSPDVVLMDVRMPRLSGIEATRQIRRGLPATEVLMLTVSDEEEDLYESSRRAPTATSSKRSPSTRSRRPCGPLSSTRASFRRP